MNTPFLKLLIGSVCISFSPIFIKLANVSPDSAGFYRMLFAGLTLLPLMWLILRATDRPDEQVVHEAPLLAYLNPGRFAAIADSLSFPFPSGMRK